MRCSRGTPTNGNTGHQPWRLALARPCAGPPGFTILELIVVLAVISIMSAAALPRIHTMLTRQRGDRATQILAGDLRTAFTSAARGRVPVRFAIQNGRGYALTNLVTGDTILRRTFASGDLGVEAISGRTLDVFPNGVGASADTIGLLVATYQRRVTVSRAGFVRVLP